MSTILSGFLRIHNLRQVNTTQVKLLGGEEKITVLCGVQYTPHIAMITGQSTRYDVKVKLRSSDSFGVLIFGQQFERCAKFKHETRTFHFCELAPSTVCHRDLTRLI